jgi:hypothetical protein
MAFYCFSKKFYATILAMLRLGNILVVIVFVLWILPLGVFIKPTDEKKVCGGQRAICLCSHIVKGKADGSKKIILAHPPSPEKETAPSGGSNGQFLAVNLHNINQLFSTKFLQHTPNLYSLIVCKSIEHVPKA